MTETGGFSDSVSSGEAMSAKKTIRQSIRSGLDRLAAGSVSVFYRLSIARKLMLGFSVLLVLMIGISANALLNLNRLNEINHSIVKTDLPIISASGKMIDLILAEELYAQRYLILKTPDMLKRYWQKETEFNQLVENLQTLPGENDDRVKRIVHLHADYHRALSQAFSLKAEASADAVAEFGERIKPSQEKIISSIKGMTAAAQQDQNQKTSLTATIGRAAFHASAVLCGLGLLFSLVAALTITRNISGAIKKLQVATGMISEGKFDYRPDIRNKDELGDLSLAFATMADRLKQLEEMSLDSSPLTRLPGGTAIENVLNNRISANAPIAFCLVDIDNFKAYNDRYGYARGNDMIQATARLIKEAVARHGSPEDFIGHVGGDDFVLISTPELYSPICQDLVEAYDQSIPGFYDAADRERGFIVGENRQGQEVRFPLASLSIGVVTNTKRKLRNHIQYGEIAAEMKEVAKTVRGSVFMADKRGDDDGSSPTDRKLIHLPPHKMGSKGH
jgi:GGDEF domain-containing protein/CHASE3 domain sensor protein